MTETIPWAKPVVSDRERRYLIDALDSSWISGGPYVDRFEREFVRYHEAAHGLTASNGTTALHMAFLALGIGPGDEVVVPGYTFVAPGNMVIACGATPVFADIDPATWCVDPASVERCIGPRTKAIVVVHVYGNVCDMDALSALAARHQLPIVEDVAEAAFSRYRGRPAGTFGELGCFSFQATKTITMGEGGFVLSRSLPLFEKMRVLRDHGMRKDKRYWHEVVGFNFRLTNLQAAIGFAQFEQIEEVIVRRRAVIEAYRARLDGVPGIELQRFRPEVDPVVWAVAARLEPSAFTRDRDGVIGALAEAGIETRPGFYPFSVLPPYESQRLPVAEEVGAQVISVPSFPTLTVDQIDHVCDQLVSLRR
ncbi:MAG TPA: DegT/DnrJ/EryC1/StrS family aminotransferase [Kofleriaceae bacterium]|jgi:perosamine synthetase